MGQQELKNCEIRYQNTRKTWKVFSSACKAGNKKSMKYSSAAAFGQHKYVISIGNTNSQESHFQAKITQIRGFSIHISKAYGSQLCKNVEVGWVIEVIQLS